MAEKVTLREIARAANVSVATVSRVLNKTGRVSPKVERIVRAALAKVGSGSRQDGTQTLCFVLANRPMLHPFHAQALMGAQAFAGEHGSHILFYPFRYDATTPPDEIRLPLLLQRSGLVDGYIMGGMNFPNLLGLLARNHTPMAVLGNNVMGDWQPEKYDVVWMDDRTGAYDMTQYLIGLDHRAIWFVRSRRFQITRMSEGYRRAMEEAGLRAEIIENDSEDEWDCGYLAFKALLSKAVPVTAVFAHSDSVARGVLEAAGDSGLRIPEDLSICGFGNRPEASAITPPLTTAWGYPDQVGRRLAELVLNRIRDPEAAAGNVVLPTRLIKRASCAKPPSTRAGKQVAPPEMALP